MKKKSQGNLFLIIIHPHKREIILTKSFKKSRDLRIFFKLAFVSMFRDCGCDIGYSSKVIRQPLFMGKKSSYFKKQDSEEMTTLNDFGPLDNYNDVVHYCNNRFDRETLSDIQRGSEGFKLDSLFNLEMIDKCT